MKYDGKPAYQWIKRRLKQERWCFKHRTQSKLEQGVSLIRQNIYENILRKIKKIKKS